MIVYSEYEVSQSKFRVNKSLRLGLTSIFNNIKITNFYENVQSLKNDYKNYKNLTCLPIRKFFYSRSTDGNIFLRVSKV